MRAARFGAHMLTPRQDSRVPISRGSAANRRSRRKHADNQRACQQKARANPST